MRQVWILLLALCLGLGLAAARMQSGKKSDKKNDLAKNEAEIREVYGRWAKAFGAHDLDGIMSVYASGNEVVSYDVAPPLQYVGKESYRKDYAEFLAQYDGPIEVEYRDMRIVAGDDVAFLHALERMSGK